jgi:hypothetical protein
MKTILISVIAASLLVGIGKAEVQPNSVPPNLIAVRIETGDDEVSKLVSNYLTKDLRSFTDVIVNQPSLPTFVIHCGCLTAMANDVTLGCVVSLVVTSNLKPLKYIAGNEAIVKAIDSAPQGQLDELKTSLAMHCRLMQAFEDQIVFTCPRMALKEKCDAFVATFDSKYLYPFRQNKYQ